MEKIKKNKGLISLFGLLYILMLLLCFMTNNFDLKVLRGDILIYLFLILLFIALFIIIKKLSVRVIFIVIALVSVFNISKVITDVYFVSKEVDIKKVTDVRTVSNIMKLNTTELEGMDDSFKVYSNGFEVKAGREYYVKIYENAKWIAIISELDRL